MSRRFRCEPKKQCRFCGSQDLHEYIDLGDQPPSNSFIAESDVADEASFPLKVNLCRSCGLSQLTHVVYAADIFDEYDYHSSTSRALVQQFQILIDELVAKFAPPEGSLVVDVGANDGIMLDRYPPRKFKVVGVEPSSAGKIAVEKGHKIFSQFFDESCAEEIAAQFGHARIITITNVFAHIDEIDTVVRGFSKLLDPMGVLLIEFPYAIDMIDQLFYDTIYHEHLTYLSVSPIARLFARVGMRSIGAKRVSVGASGPAIQLCLCKDDAPYISDGAPEELMRLEQEWGLSDSARYESFSQRVREHGTALHALLDDLRKQGKRIAAFSAPAKGNTLLNSNRLGTGEIAVISENNTAKIGKLAPGSHIPIISDAQFLQSNYDYALLLAWNYAEFFVNKSDYAKQGGKFIIPLPVLHVAP